MYLKTWAKGILIPSGLTVWASLIDAAIRKNIFGSGMTALVISNEEMNDMKIVKSVEQSGVLIKGVCEQFKMKQKNKTLDFLECY